MYKNIKVILIGGSPMSGKTTLALKLAAKYEYGCISTDDIGEIVGTVTDFNPMKGCDYREYYVKNSVEDLLSDTSRYHQLLWPSIKHLIEVHSAWGTPIIIEGWALYPKLVNSVESENVKTIWLISDKDALEQRLAKNRSFYKEASSEESMITNYLQRSLWHNEKIFSEVAELNSDYIHVTKDLPLEELVAKTIQILAKK